MTTALASMSPHYAADREPEMRSATAARQAFWPQPPRFWLLSRLQARRDALERQIAALLAAPDPDPLTLHALRQEHRAATDRMASIRRSAAALRHRGV